MTVLVSVVIVMLRWAAGRVGEAGRPGLTVVLRVVRNGLLRLGLSEVSAADPWPDSSALAPAPSPLLLRAVDAERRKGLSRSFAGDSRDGVVGRTSDGFGGEAFGELRSAEGELVSSFEPGRRNGEARLELANRFDVLNGLEGPGADDWGQVS